MITITFRQSKSIRYKEAMKHALFLGDPKLEDGFHKLELSMKTIIEKWEWFNLLFWIILDWKGTTVTYDEVEYHSHGDKARIFYALQQIHSNWMNYTTSKLVTSYKNEDTTPKAFKQDPYKMKNEEVDRLIEVMVTKNKAKKDRDRFLEEMERMVKE